LVLALGMMTNAQAQEETSPGVSDEQMDAILGEDDAPMEDQAAQEEEAAPAPSTEEPPADAEQPLPPEIPMQEILEPEQPAEETIAQPGDTADTDSPASQFGWSDFVDTKINITYADDNVLENSEFSPAIGIGQRNTSEFTGQVGDIQPIDVQHTHLVLHHRGRGYLPGLLTEAALVLRFTLSTDPTSGSPDTSVGDDGTFLTIGYVFNDNGEKSIEGEESAAGQTTTGDQMILALTGFPMDSDRFLLGYHYDLTWGGETSFPQNRDPVPGLRLSFSHPMVYAFAGFKTHLQPKKDKLNTERVPVETVYAGLFGFGVRPIPFDKGLLIEANGGIIQKGDNPTIAEPAGSDSAADDIVAWGVSGRIGYGMGMPISDRLDLRLYQNDPRKRFSLARRDVYNPTEFSFRVSGEFDYLSQNLADPEKFGGTKAFNAPAALLSAKFKYDYFRVHLEGAYRSLAFLLFDTPGFIPFQAFPSTVKTNPELYGVVSFDYYIRQAYLTLGITGGFKKPASYRGSSAVPNLAVVKRKTTSSAYISPFNRPIEILPAGKDAFNIIEAKFDVQFDLSDWMTMMFELSYTLDNNRVKLTESPYNSEQLIKVFEDSSVTNRLGVALVIQAMF
jgi:hypothetical protein